MAKYKIRNSKDFKTDIWSFYQNILQKMGKRNFLQMILIFERLEKCQDEDHPDNLNFSWHTFSLQLLMLLIFQLKRICNLWLLKETFGHFSRRLKIGTYFSCNTFAFRFVEKNFFQEMVLKTFLIPSLYII